MVLSNNYFSHFLPSLFIFFSLGIACSSASSVINVLAIPEHILAFEGEHIYVYMLTGQNLTRCWVITGSRLNINLMPSDNSTYGFEYWGSGISAGVCGVHSNSLTIEDMGSWSLRGQDSANNTYQARFAVDVYEYPNLDIHEEYLHLDSSGNFKDQTISLMPNNTKNEYSAYCTIYSPSSQLPSYVQYQGCSIHIDKLTKAYSGQWISKLGIEGLTEEVFYSTNITIEVIKPHLISGWELAASGDGSIDLYCNLEGIPSSEFIHYCRFIRPGDKKGIHISNRVGNGQYFGYGMNNNECRLTMEQHDFLDYGQWDCIVKTNNLIYASQINFSEPRKSNGEGSYQDQKNEVLLGQSTFILCKSAHSLSACYISSPKGELVSAETNRLAFKECVLKIETAEETHNGTWECFMSSENGVSVSTFELIVWDKEFIASTPYVSASSGATAFLLCRSVLTSRKTSPSLASCRFISPNGTSISPSQEISVLNGTYQYYGTGLHYGDCGLQIGVVNKEDAGRWLCMAQLYGSLTESYAEIVIHIAGMSSQTPPGNEKHILSEESVPKSKVNTVAWKTNVKDGSNVAESSEIIYVEIGDKVVLNCEVTGALYCTIVPPNKDQFLFSPGPCTQTVEYITLAEIGPWNCYIGTDKFFEESVKAIELVLQGDGESVGWKNSDTHEMGIDLFCNIKKPLTYCRFVNPSGGTFRIIEGLGTSSLAYYGRGLTAGDCGITVTDLLEEDYGTWRCVLGISDGETIETETRLINLQTSIKNEMKMLTLERAIQITSIGSELSLSCQADYMLKYCWIKHPNGTRVYAYTNLPAGNCVAVTVAAMSDSGAWECHFGFSNGEEIAYIDVTVTGSTLYAPNKVVATGSSLSFICQSVPLGRSLKYCRFIRPDGNGFSLTTGFVYEHYSYVGAGMQYGECGVEIKDPKAEDYGVWRCAALLIGEAIEGSDIITITDTGSWSIAAIVATSVGLSLLVLAIGVGGVYYVRKKISSSVLQSCPCDAVSNTSSEEGLSNTQELHS